MSERKASALTARSVDAATLKAFAHPLRMRMYDHLKDHGAATASMLARAMGESTGQTSYHLRQLERHGLVEEETGRGSARERWWVAVGFSFGPEVAAGDADDGTRTAAQAVMHHQLRTRTARLQEWVDRMDDEDPDWAAASLSNEVTTLLTASEVESLSDALAEVLREHLDRAKAARDAGQGEGRRMVKLYQQVFPLPASGDGEGEGEGEG
jgi:DNA-binding transcriptional ArsR family regulator